jgi:hypothetical protein
MRKYCAELGREGMYKKALEIAERMTDPKLIPQDVMKCVGEMKALAQGAKTDMYWDEKVDGGYQRLLNRARRDNYGTDNGPYTTNQVPKTT